MDRRFGFAFVDIGGLLVGGYNATQFYNGMFKTPPFPSTWMAGIIDSIAGDPGNFSISSGIGRFLTSVMSSIVADGLNVKIVVMVATNITNTTQVNNIANFVAALRAHPAAAAIGGFGWRCEQTSVITPSTATPAQWDSAFATVRQAVTAAGWPTVNYYSQGFGGTATEQSKEGWCYHTNFPQADQIGNLDNTDTYNSIGITHGTDGPCYFVDSNDNPVPNPGCEGAGDPNFNDVALPLGYIPPNPPAGAVACRQNWPPIIDYIMSRDGINPLSTRQWCFWIAGNNAADFTYPSTPVRFLNVAGKVDNPLWASKTFRNDMANWIANNPGYFLENSTPPPAVKSTVLTITVT